MDELDPRAPSPPHPPLDERLDSWKEIAAYLKRDGSTVRRWEKEQGLPVRRHSLSKRSAVYAYRSEIDAWWHTRPRVSESRQSGGGTSPHLVVDRRRRREHAGCGARGRVLAHYIPNA